MRSSFIVLEGPLDCTFVGELDCPTHSVNVCFYLNKLAIKVRYTFGVAC